MVTKTQQLRTDVADLRAQLTAVRQQLAEQQKQIEQRDTAIAGALPFVLQAAPQLEDLARASLVFGAVVENGQAVVYYAQDVVDGTERSTTLRVLPGADTPEVQENDRLAVFVFRPFGEHPVIEIKSTTSVGDYVYTLYDGNLTSNQQTHMVGFTTLIKRARAGDDVATANKPLTAFQDPAVIAA